MKNKEQRIIKVDVFFENLIECLSAVKTAKSNKIKNFKIDENLKAETIKTRIYFNPISLFILSVITYIISYYSALSVMFVAYIYFKYISKHPTFKLMILWLKHGATRNQIEVIYYQVFNHVFKLRYTLLVPSITIFLVILFYTTKTPFDSFDLVLFEPIISVFSDINNITIFIINAVENDTLKEIFIYSLSYSPIRATAAFLNTFAVLFLVLINTLQIFRRPL